MIVGLATLFGFFVLIAVLFNGMLHYVWLGQVRYVLTVLQNEVVVEQVVPSTHCLNFCSHAGFKFVV